MDLRPKISGRALFAVISAPIPILLIAAILLISRPPLAARLLGADTPESAAEAEVARLMQQTPELFTGAYGGRDADQLRARLTGAAKDRNLLVAEAKRRGITDVEDKLQTSFEGIRAGYGTDADFKRYLFENHMTERRLKAAIRDNLLISGLAKDLVGESDITEAEAGEYFEANKARYATNASKRVSHILFDKDDIDTAAAVRAQIDAGADFAMLAAEHSKDGGSAGRAGDIGWSTSTYPDTFQQAVDALGTGEVSQPVATQYGIHLIKVIDTKEGTSAFETVREQVVADLLGKRRADAIGGLLRELKGGIS